MKDKPYYSHSQLDMFFGCGEQWRRRYIEKEIIPPPIKTLKGRAVHLTSQENFTQKIKSYQDMKLNHLKELAVSQFEATLKHESFTLTQDEVSRGAKIVLGEAKDRVVAITEVYGEQMAPSIQPVLVEEKIRIVTPKEFDLLGIVDIVDNKQVIHDLKTGRKRNVDDVQKSTQLTWYSMSYKNRFGKDPLGLIINNIVENKASVYHQEIPTQREMRDYEILLSRINLMHSQILRGVFMPASPDNWRCSPTWCGYWTTCPYVNSERIVRAKAREEE